MLSRMEVVMGDKSDEGKSIKRYSEEELVEKLTPYLAHSDELEGLTLSDEEFEWIVDKLENPLEQNPRLKALLKRKAPWES